MCYSKQVKSACSHSLCVTHTKTHTQWPQLTVHDFICTRRLNTHTFKLSWQEQSEGEGNTKKEMLCTALWQEAQQVSWDLLVLTQGLSVWLYLFLTVVETHK